MGVCERAQVRVTVVAETRMRLGVRIDFKVTGRLSCSETGF